MTEIPEVKIPVGVQMSVGSTMPEYKSTLAAGFDLAAAEPAVIDPGKVVMVSTGLAIKIPESYFIAVFARGSLHKRGLMLANNVGIIDEDYCGPNDIIQLPLLNFTPDVQHVAIGDRLAQGIFLPYSQQLFYQTKMTGKNRGGFGSTGKSNPPQPPPNDKVKR